MSEDEDIEEQMKNFPFPPLPPGLSMPPPLPPTFIDDNIEQALNDIDQTLLDVANTLDSTQSMEPNTDFKSIWEKRKATDPSIGAGSRESMHGHIDRIAKGEVGTLLDRFQNRFGSELDKEIIVLRKKQQQDMRSIKPIVELISVPEKDDSMNMSEFMESMKDNDFLSKVSEVTNISEEQLSELSNAELKKFFKSADKDKSGTVDFNEFVSEILELDSSKDEFVDFFNIVNDLLGDAPDEFINTFLASDDFKLFEEIGKEPNSASTEDRNNFFLMINRVLGDLPTDTINNFVNSPDFEIFSRMGELYGE
jgi:Ca2+-binding EF-hand superfamily protein